VTSLLAAWPEFLRILINTGIMVALLTYRVMPFLTRCCKGWLFR
jgi:antibiotic biosynthesis monooxygenase (ABM) superfamily enzyme